MIVTLSKRVNLLNYEHIDVSVSQTFDDSTPWETAHSFVRSCLSDAIVKQLKDHLILNEAIPDRKAYLENLVEFYSIPESERQ